METILEKISPSQWLKLVLLCLLFPTTLLTCAGDWAGINGYAEMRCRSTYHIVAAAGSETCQE